MPFETAKPNTWAVIISILKCIPQKYNSSKVAAVYALLKG